MRCPEAAVQCREAADIPAAVQCREEVARSADSREACRILAAGPAEARPVGCRNLAGCRILAAGPAVCRIPEVDRMGCCSPRIGDRDQADSPTAQAR